jgi:hypothetical protein
MDRWREGEVEDSTRKTMRKLELKNERSWIREELRVSCPVSVEGDAQVSVLRPRGKGKRGRRRRKSAPSPPTPASREPCPSCSCSVTETAPSRAFRWSCSLKLTLHSAFFPSPPPHLDSDPVSSRPSAASPPVLVHQRHGEQSASVHLLPTPWGSSRCARSRREDGGA